MPQQNNKLNLGDLLNDVRDVATGAQRPQVDINYNIPTQDIVQVAVAIVLVLIIAAFFNNMFHFFVLKATK